MDKEQAKNIAFIDGQNLYMATKESVEPWSVDFTRFRIYLLQKYGVERAYYHLGYLDEENQDLYEQIQNAGFILVFKKHNPAMMGKKKGNVDSDIIFSAMRRVYKKENFDKVIFVSGDGDYKALVDFLIEENRFAKILFPSRRNYSSLYKALSNNFFAFLDNPDTKDKIEHKKEKGALGN